MSRFLFYLEYDGKRTVSNTYEAPVDVVQADGVLGAISLFAEKNKLKKVRNEGLMVIIVLFSLKKRISVVQENLSILSRKILENNMGLII